MLENGIWNFLYCNVRTTPGALPCCDSRDIGAVAMPSTGVMGGLNGDIQAYWLL